MRWCIFSPSHLLQLKPTRTCWWEEQLMITIMTQDYLIKLILFIRLLFLSFLLWLSLRLAIVSQLIYMLMSLETDVYCDTQTPDFQDARLRMEVGDVRQIFCLVNVRLWNTSTDTHRPECCVLSMSEKGDSGTVDPWYTSLPAFRERERETGEVFLSMLQWFSRAVQEEEGRGIWVDTGKEREREWQ